MDARPDRQADKRGGAGASLKFPEVDPARLGLRYEAQVVGLTGSASISIDLPLPAAEAVPHPALALQYSSGGANSAFGVGWSLAGVPSISINTRKGCPRYTGHDDYVASGAGELVPMLVETDHGTGARTPDRPQQDFKVEYYRPRNDGFQLRVERWTHRKTGAVHFRTRDARDVLTTYGLDAAGSSRLFDPDDSSRVFSWLAETEYHPDGRCVHFEHAAEDERGLDPSLVFERARPSLAQRYLKRVRYGNSTPIAAGEPVPADTAWCFEVVLDYGDHPSSASRPGGWPVRVDPFTTCHPGFEVRTYRLCRRLLVFHRFSALGDAPVLVGAIALQHDPHPEGTTLVSVGYTGHRSDMHGAREERALPSLRFEYSAPRVAAAFEGATRRATENVPHGLSGPEYRWADLYGEGIPGILAQTAHAWYFKRNEGGGIFGPMQVVARQPACSLSECTLGDFAGDGNPKLAVLHGREGGFYELDRDRGTWSGFQPFEHLPHVESLGGHAQWLDVDADGRADLVITAPDRVTWYPCLGRAGFEDAVDAVRAGLDPSEPAPPLAESGALSFFFADMNGDGLVDQVRVQNGRVEFWPQLGNGRFGERIVMDGAPTFAPDDEFDPRRVIFVDLDGSGTADLVYVGKGEVSYWINACGNRFGERQVIAGLPCIDNQSSLQVLDLLVDGTPCLVWSSPLPGSASPLEYLPLTGGIKPRLLLSLDDSQGRLTEFDYSTSASHYLRDREAGRPWRTHIPSHPTVVDGMRVSDRIGGTHAVLRYEYHDGYFDGGERQFRGFASVDQFDAETLAGTGTLPELTYTTPTCTRTWHFLGDPRFDAPNGQYELDAKQPRLPPFTIEGSALSDADDYENALRAIAGSVIRQELFGLDGQGNLRPHPFNVTQQSYRVRRLQPSHEGHEPAFHVVAAEKLDLTYEERAGDPRVGHELVLDVDPYGAPTLTAKIGYPRRAGIATNADAQAKPIAVVETHGQLHFDADDRYELAVPVEQRTFEMSGLVVPTGGIWRTDDLRTIARAAIANPLLHKQPFSGAKPEARIAVWQRSYYWDDDQSQVAAFATAGRPVLPHHQEQACFTPGSISQIFGGLVDATNLPDEGYHLADGHWWRSGETQGYLPREEFHRLAYTERPGEGRTQLTYDAERVCLIREVDRVGNDARAEIDYFVLAPWQITDTNDNIREARYDALGVPIAASHRGEMLDESDTLHAYGFDPIDAWQAPSPGAPKDVVASPQSLVQRAASATWYSLDTGPDGTSPPCLVVIANESLLHDGTDEPSPPRYRTEITYLDGFRRPLQNRRAVEPGPAIVRDAQGKLVLGADGTPAELDSADRWVVTGFTLFNRKQQPIRQYEPFCSTGFAFEDEASLARYGVFIQTQYDAAGREIRQDMPDGTVSRVEFAPWATAHFDPNDNIEESAWGDAHKNLPARDPEGAAYTRTLPHRNTPKRVHLDPLGREVRTEELAAAGSAEARSTEVLLDVAGNPLVFKDARQLDAFQYDRDLAGRLLRVRSVDAGDRWTLPDAYDRERFTWDARPMKIERRFDVMDRPTAILAHDGANPRTVETMLYGDDLTVADAVARNARGQLVEHRDQAGQLAIERYTPSGQVLAGERRLCRRYDVEPDWSSFDSVNGWAPEVWRSRARYDALDRPVEQHPPDGTIRRISYLPSGGVGRIDIAGEDGRVPATTLLDDARFNARGQRLTARLGANIQVATTYDRRTFRPTTIRAIRDEPDGGTTILQDLHFAYDPAGNVVRTWDPAQDPGPRGPVLNGLSEPTACDYTYDGFYQLVEATGRVHLALTQSAENAGAERSVARVSRNDGGAVRSYHRFYEYDLAGNRKRMQHIQGGANGSTGWTTAMWISNTSNRSLPALDANGNPVRAPETCFDASGNLTWMANVRKLDWDWAGRLQRAVAIDRSHLDTKSDGEYYRYGADGMRVRRVSEKRIKNGAFEVTEKLYLDGCEIKRTWLNDEPNLYRRTSVVSDESGVIARVHTWEQDDTGRETLDVKQVAIRYPIAGYLPSVRLELDGRGGVATYEEYFPFGGTAFVMGDDDREVTIEENRFSGKERDEVTGLYYFGHRYYAPWMGRWVSPDPIGRKDHDNLFVYVQNRPTGLSDSTGLESYKLTLPGISPPFIPDPTLTYNSTLGISRQGSAQDGSSLEPSSWRSPPLPPDRPQNQQWLDPATHWLLYSNNSIAVYFQDDRNLKRLTQQIVYGVIALELTLATGGLASPWILGGLEASLGAGAATSLLSGALTAGLSNAVGGSALRFSMTSANGGTATNALRASVDPYGLLTDISGAVGGEGLFHAANRGFAWWLKKPAGLSTSLSLSRGNVSPAGQGKASDSWSSQTEGQLGPYFTYDPTSPLRPSNTSYKFHLETDFPLQSPGGVANSARPLPPTQADISAARFNFLFIESFSAGKPMVYASSLDTGGTAFGSVNGPVHGGTLRFDPSTGEFIRSPSPGVVSQLALESRNRFQAYADAGYSMTQVKLGNLGDNNVRIGSLDAPKTYLEGINKASHAERLEHSASRTPSLSAPDGTNFTPINVPRNFLVLGRDTCRVCNEYFRLTAQAEGAPLFLWDEFGGGKAYMPNGSIYPIWYIPQSGSR